MDFKWYKNIGCLWGKINYNYAYEIWAGISKQLSEDMLEECPEDRIELSFKGYFEYFGKRYPKHDSKMEDYVPAFYILLSIPIPFTRHYLDFQLEVHSVWHIDTPGKPQKMNWESLMGRFAKWFWGEPNLEQVKYSQFSLFHIKRYVPRYHSLIGWKKVKSLLQKSY